VTSPSERKAAGAAPQPVPVDDLLACVAGASRSGPSGAEVALVDVTHDSREAGPGVLFACRPGARADGHDFAPAAVAAGSPALLVQRPLPLDAPQIVVPSVAEALGWIAARIHGEPSTRLDLVGITGTNGKTTTAFLMEAVQRAAGHRTGLLGTVQTRIAGEPVPGVRTTPESTDLQRLLARMVAAGVTAATMEVSRHGLALGRVNGTRFAAAAFTNLTQDHLDFHRDLEDYFAAKARLFTPAFAPAAVINVDDPFGRRLADQVDLEVVRLSTAGEGGADVGVSGLVADAGGSSFTAHLRGATVPVRTFLPGHYNVANVLTALALAEMTGLDVRAAAAGVGSLPGVPGRMERVDAGQAFAVLVDYAHTPDSLENVLRAAREVAEGSVIVVIGCGGDRDRGKRPLMGRAAAALADLAVLTSDNPRSEDPEAILAAMEQGAREVPGARVLVEVDRREGIGTALRAASSGDVVVVAGKGHETYQELADRTIPFDDRQVVRELLAAGGVPA
jgi:UDP-N-acetylmuramoyl-L-alanyl-D-glutamate--2,6-diaminopimelate ligase